MRRGLCSWLPIVVDAHGSSTMCAAGWPAKKGEVLVVNSTEVRAVQGRVACDFMLHPICLPTC